MIESPFSNPEFPPDEKALERAFGTNFKAYRQLMTLAVSFSREWNFSKTSGWMLKVFTKKKALFYLTHLEGGFKLSLTIRESEREAFLQDGELVGLHEKIAAAKKFVEGVYLQFEILSETDFEIVEPFITKLINLRINS
ncbi:MAG: hypothetical protein C0410_11385 [Anaerolinea sp.]|nr:hypothetical protein [Anaerolinea sp.]